MSDGAPPTVTPGSASGEFIVTAGDRIERFYGIQRGDTTWVFHDGTVYEVQSDSGARRGGRGHHHGELTAPMPATVIAVNVRLGAAVKRGDVLLVLEAMKMELPVRAEADGTVTAIHCAGGDLVQPGIALIEIDA